MFWLVHYKFACKYQELTTELNETNDSLKEMSRSAQQLSKQCTEEVGAAMIAKVKQVKEMFQQIQRSVSER